jgi:hypothetical protein
LCGQLEEYINPNAASEWEKYDYKTVCVKWIKNMPIPAQYEIIKPILCHPDVTGIEIDIGTIGRTLSDLVTADLPLRQAGCIYEWEESGDGRDV